MKAQPHKIAMKRIMEEKGLTCREVSRRIQDSPHMSKKLSKSMVAWVSDGRFIPFDSQIQELAEVIGVDNPDSLLEIEDDCFTENSNNPKNLSDPENLQHVWQVILDNLKREKAAYGVLFLNAKVDYDTFANKLIIVFARENEFAYKTVHTQEFLDTFRYVLTTVCGPGVSFSFERR